LFLLKLKEHRHLTQVAINDIIEDCQGISTHTRDYLLATMRVKMAEVGLDEEKTTEIEAFLNTVAQPFDGIETFYKQEKYFAEEFGYVVSLYTYNVQGNQIFVCWVTNHKSKSNNIHGN